MILSKKIVTNYLDDKKKLYFLLFGFLFAFSPNEVSAQSAAAISDPGIYTQPYCSSSQMTYDQHIAIEKSKKVNALYATIIKEDAAFKEKLDRYAQLNCSLRDTPDSTARDAQMKELSALKSAIKTTRNNFNTK